LSLISPILQRDTNTVTIATFYENYLLSKYNFKPPYQRQSVWNEEKQSFLIDSILKNFPIPPIFLHQHIDESTGKTTYDVIDGKQRLLALIRFINNEIPVSSEREHGDAFYDSKIAGANFSDLDKPELAAYKKQFWRYTIPIEYIDTPSSEVIDDIFDRLNRNGEPLTGQELRNAKYHGTPFLSLVQRLTMVPFWAARLKNVDVSRMEDQEFISELLFVLLEHGPLEALPPIIDSLYEKYTSTDINWLELEAIFMQITEFMEELGLDYEGYRIGGVSHLYGLWSFSWHCYGLQVLPETVSTSLIQLFDELRSNRISNRDVGEYKKTMSSNTKSKSMRFRRLDALIGYCRLETLYG
jgi:hypothetical protein